MFVNRLLGFALRVGIPADDYDRFSVMPQRGYGLQPRVAASATLGKESDLALTRYRVVVLTSLPRGSSKPNRRRLTPAVTP